MSETQTSGHVFVRDGKRGPVWYAKYRVGDDQYQKAIGPAHTKRGRCPEGKLTRAKAEAELERLVGEAEGAGAAPASAVTFADACEEYLRFVTDIKRRDPTTIKDYRSVIDGHLLGEFGDRELGSSPRTTSTPTRKG